MRYTIEISDVCEMIEQGEFGCVTLSNFLMVYAAKRQKQGYDCSKIIEFATKFGYGELDNKWNPQNSTKSG